MITTINEYKKLNENVWPQSKLSSSFQMYLKAELQKTFKGIFWVKDYTLFVDDKELITIDPDKDNINSIINKITPMLQDAIKEGVTYPKESTILYTEDESGNKILIKEYPTYLGAKRSMNKLWNIDNKYNVLGVMPKSKWDKEFIN